MKRDFKTWMIVLVFSLPVVAVLFISIIYFSNCGVNADCSKGNLAGVIHTAVPTLAAATTPNTVPLDVSLPTPDSSCEAPAATLLSAWISSGYSEDTAFIYQDNQGNNCSATFKDVEPLFDTPNLWYSGALACTSCHDANLSASSAGLDLSSYSGILAGSQRKPTSPQGTNILGEGDWTSSILNQVLFVQKQMPVGAPSGAIAEMGPSIHAGQITSMALSTATKTPSDEVEVPQPSNPGGPGEAVNLTGDPTAGAKVYSDNCATCHGENGVGGVPNPGSTDETVPSLNPIDPLLKNADFKTFATNIDLFIQHGSAPEGPNPFRVMPAWGDQNALTQQQIADVIAYIISLNK
jgi:mono/diheme cytochrome c family protein